MTEPEAHVLVAIPAQDDYVWKLSSEKVPHMTMLYLANLGDNVERVLEFLAHAAETFNRFGLSVDHRGTLGQDNADVVFFENNYALSPVNKFRNGLLLNKDIRAAYDSVTQFPEWTPHLTMGYPATPAKVDTREYPGIHYVQFDRLALWTSEYSGVEIPLTSDQGMEVAMSSIVGAKKPSLDELAHHGVKGQKWGVVRNGKVTSGASKQSRADQKAYLNTEHDRIKSSSKEVKKQFKSDVKSAKKGEGLPNSRITGTYAGKHGEETSLFTGKFKNNKGEKVTEEYGNLVLAQAVKQQDFKRKVVAGAAFAAVVLASSR